MFITTPAVIIYTFGMGCSWLVYHVKCAGGGVTPHAGTALVRRYRWNVGFCRPGLRAPECGIRDVVQKAGSGAGMQAPECELQKTGSGMRDPECRLRAKNARGDYVSLQMAGGGVTPHASTVPALLRRYRRNVMLVSSTGCCCRCRC